MDGSVTIAGWVALLAAPASVDAPDPRTRDDEIVIEGRRTGDRYRLPPATRLSAVERRGPTATDLRLACNGVGPYGCGTDVLPILTVHGDGSVQIGADREQP